MSFNRADLQKVLHVLHRLRFFTVAGMKTSSSALMDSECPDSPGLCKESSLLRKAWTWIKAVSFYRNCDAVLVGEYNRVI